MITAPTQISNCQVWLDASDTTSLFQLSGGTTAVAANLDPVGYWGDKSGNARHFTNIGGSATTRPTWVSSLSTVRFDGSNDYLSSFFNITYTAQTVFVVLSEPLLGTSQGRIYTQTSSGGVDTTATGHFIPLLRSGNTYATGSYASSNFMRSEIFLRGSSLFDICSVTHSGTNIRNFVNGSSGSLFSHTLNYAVALSRLGAATTTASTYFNGDISEVIVYNRALTDLERADVEYYLTRKWNFLNSIPRQTYAVKNGLWSDSATWSVSAEPSPWNFPLSADNAYTNTFTVTADSSTKVDTIRNSTLAPNILSGGSFVLANGVSLSALPWTGGVLTLVEAASAEVVANFTLNYSFGTANPPIKNTTTSGNLNLRGDINLTGGGNTNYYIENSSSGSIVHRGKIDVSNIGGAVNVDAIRNSGSGTVSVYGDIYGGQAAGGNYTSNTGVRHNGSGNTFVFGNVYGRGTNGPGVYLAGTGTATVSGNVYGGSSSESQGIYAYSGTQRLNVYGNTFASNASPALTYTTTPSLSVYGNIINAPNGRQAIYAPRYQVFPSASATYTRQAVNGYDSYADYWTSNATFTYPASSDVVLNTAYKNNTLTGSMALPPASAVALGASVGTTSGTASLTLEGLLNQSVAALNTSNSIGARLKNVATTQALSAVSNSLNFNN